MIKSAESWGRLPSASSGGLLLTELLTNGLERAITGLHDSRLNSRSLNLKPYSSSPIFTAYDGLKVNGVHGLARVGGTSSP